MRELFKNTPPFIKIEFGAITTVFVFVVWFFITNIFRWNAPVLTDISYKSSFAQVNMPFNFYSNYFFPGLISYMILYPALLTLNFAVIPGLLRKKALMRNAMLLIAVFASLILMYSITGSYIHAYRYAGSSRDVINNAIFRNGFDQAVTVIWLLIIYTAIKYAVIRLLDISKTIEAKYRFIRKEAIIAAAVWLIGLLLLRFGRAGNEFFAEWAIIVPSAILLYLVSFYILIPRSSGRSLQPFFFYMFQCAILLFFIFIAIYLISVFINDKDDAGATYSAFNVFFQFFITMPVTWLIYKRYLKNNNEINDLRKALKKSDAKFDFLRSQINPHFLFNALNTLYGTAIQENAERTGEGIQKLGDMMRFMLQENMKDKICLEREIDYLNNYIDLQKLRTDNNSMVQIETEIPGKTNTLHIAPMLLIPFIENAFKHGISFREPSYIKAVLKIKGTTLRYDVYNSKHIRQDNDPEKYKTGIGLANVKQRLMLSYPNSHELIIRDTDKEFSIHLIIQLQAAA